MKTKRFLLAFVLIFTSSVLHAQGASSLNEMKEEDRKEYLVNLTNEVVQNFGPDYLKYCDFDRGPVFEKRETKEGRVFYSVSYYPKGLGEKTEYSFARQNADGTFTTITRRYIAVSVDIWENSGQPKCVNFENAFGYDFERSDETYQEWIKRGVKENEKVRRAERK